MDREIVIVTPTERAAFQAWDELRRLDAEGTIELYAAAVIAKDADGRVSLKKRDDQSEGLATFLGFTTGALIGLIAGPAGAAAGSAIGGTAGLTGDVAYSGFAGDFVHDVATRLEPGKTAVCASVWEDWTEPVDASMAPFGAQIFRQGTYDMALAQLRSEMKAIDDEQAHVESEIAKSTGEMKANLQKKRDELRAKQDERRAHLRQRASELRQSWDAKVASIEDKTNKAEADAKARHYQHKEKLARFAAEQKASFRELFA